MRITRTSRNVPETLQKRPRNVPEASLGIVGGIVVGIAVGIDVDVVVDVVVVVAHASITKEPALHVPSHGFNGESFVS